MPFFKASSKLIYFAHIPKCGGSSVERYLIERFGPLGFLDTAFMARPDALRWSKTSPQHIDWLSLQTLWPPGMIDASFAVVRHPLARIISAYHFEMDMAKTVAAEMRFSDWLQMQFKAATGNPFLVDHHIRRQVDFIPDDCAIFHLEHGLDAIVPYLDTVTGSRDGPRAVGQENRGAKNRVHAQKSGTAMKATAQLSEGDLRLIADFYAADFRRLGYRLSDSIPLAERPVLNAAYQDARDREVSRRVSLFFTFKERVRRKFRGQYAIMKLKRQTAGFRKRS